MTKANEKRRRSIVKSIVYRAISVIVDLVVAYLFTKNFAASIGIVLFVDGYSTAIYYIHERAWSHISWGKK